MLLGAACASHRRITKADKEEAYRRLSRMAFVGLTDAFNASVCLLFHMYEGDMREWMFGTHARWAVISGCLAICHQIKACVHRSVEAQLQAGLVVFDGKRGAGHRVEKSYWCVRMFF